MTIADRGTPAASPYEIAIDSVSVRFPSGDAEVVALHDVNLNIKENEFICIMGPSGCGKTTLLNAIAGFVKPTSGSIYIEGQPVTKAGPDRAVVFQSDAVFPWMTVEENVGFSPRVRGKSKEEIKETVDRYVELVGLRDFRKAWPKELSGGMREARRSGAGVCGRPESIVAR
jgi:NitT/TauT family transport system ATP-binding protein